MPTHMIEIMFPMFLEKYTRLTNAVNIGGYYATNESQILYDERFITLNRCRLDLTLWKAPFQSQNITCSSYSENLS